MMKGMARTILTHTLAVLTGVLLVAGASGVFAQWTGPTAIPPNANVAAPVNTGSTNQVKSAGLSLDALTVFGNTLLSGVSNYLNFGTVPTPADPSTGYGIRDNAGTMEFKDNGGSWTAIASAGGGASVTGVTACIKNISGFESFTPDAGMIIGYNLTGGNGGSPGGSSGSLYSAATPGEKVSGSFVADGSVVTVYPGGNGGSGADNIGGGGGSGWYGGAGGNATTGRGQGGGGGSTAILQGGVLVAYAAGGTGGGGTAGGTNSGGVGYTSTTNGSAQKGGNGKNGGANGAIGASNGTSSSNTTNGKGYGNGAKLTYISDACDL